MLIVPGCSFSVIGDLITTAVLVKSVINGSITNGRFISEFGQLLVELLGQIQSLDTVLRQISHIEVNEVLSAEANVLNHQAAQIESIVFDFFHGSESYQSSFPRTSGTISLQSKWETLSRRKAAARFKEKLHLHIMSFEILLTIFQWKYQSTTLPRSELISQTLNASSSQDGFSKSMRKLPVTDNMVNQITFPIHAQLRNCQVADCDSGAEGLANRITSRSRPQCSLDVDLPRRRHFLQIRFCYILISLGILIVVGSLIPALWRSSVRHDLSGGFGLAQYILGVGVFVVGSMAAIHSRSCRCWRSHEAWVSFESP